MATSVLVSLIVLLSFHGFQVDGKVDRYALNIVENGTSVHEQVEVDVENNIEVIRVPQHNNVDAMEIMNDFDAGLSASRLPAIKDCYVSKLDSSLPSPAEMKLDMDQMSRQSLPDKVRTEKTRWIVLGFADRLALPKKILDFCGSFPIFNVETIPLDSMNATLLRISSHGRRKRSHWIKRWNGCFRSDESKMNTCLNKYGPNFTKIKLKCKYDKHTCFYIAECRHYDPNAMSTQFKCEEIVHRMNWRATCCSPSC